MGRLSQGYSLIQPSTLDSLPRPRPRHLWNGSHVLWHPAPHCKEPTFCQGSGAQFASCTTSKREIWLDLQTLGETTILTCFNTERIWEFYAFPSGVTKAGAVVTCRHISEPEFVETLLLLREGWQGGKGKQKEAWIWFEGYAEEHSVPTVDLQTLTCSHVAVLEVCCLLRTVLFFYLMYQLHFETLRNQVLVRDMSWFYHLVGKRMRQTYCQNLDIPMLSPFTKVV